MKPLTTEQLIVFFLAVLTLALFAPTVSYDFVSFDDAIYVSENEQVLAGLTAEGLRWAWTTGHAGYYQPVTWMSFQLDAQLCGREPWGFHLNNVLWHTANVVLIFVVLRRLTGAVGRSAVVAALFAVHPLHVESVAWVTERKDVLSMFFGLLAIWSYAAYAGRPSAGRYALAMVSFTLSVLAKSMLVTLPCMLLLLDVWPMRRWRGVGPVWLIVEKLPLFAVAFAMGIATIVTHHRVGGMAPLEGLPIGMRLANAVAAYVWYLGKTFWPVDLAPFYGYFTKELAWWQVTGAGALLLAITMVVFAGWRRFPYLGMGWLWFVLGLVPVIGLMQAGDQAVADRFTYYPHFGLFIAVIWGMAELFERLRTPQKAPLVVAATVWLALAACTWRQVGYWRDSITVLEHSLRVQRANPIAHYMLGDALQRQENLVAAVEHYAEAVRLEPGHPKLRIGLGAALLKVQRPAEAVVHYRGALRFYPDRAELHFFLGVALTQSGQGQAAIEHFAQAVRLDRELAVAHFNLGHLLRQSGRIAEASLEYRAALERRAELDSGWPRAAASAAWELATDPDPKRRDGSTAVELAERACEAAAYGDPRLLDVLAAAYAEVGQFDHARVTAQQAQALAAPREPQLSQAIQTRLDLYRISQPYRTGPSKSSP
jgi:protein O-mannosyl-transferase